MAKKEEEDNEDAKDSDKLVKEITYEDVDINNEDLIIPNIE